MEEKNSAEIINGIKYSYGVPRTTFKDFLETFQMPDCLFYLFRKDERIQGVYKKYSKTPEAIQAGYFLEESRERSGHRFGDGGEEEEDRTFLKLNGKTILATMLYFSYSTTSDDLFDWTGNSQNHTYLFQEDGLARIIFEELKKLNLEVEQEIKERAKKIYGNQNEIPDKN